MKAKSKKVKNTDILSAGSKIYAKKRKAKQETVEYVEFDPEKRQEYLTGFHKRKLERKNKTKEKYAKLAKEEKLRSRREAREERQRLADKNVQEMAAMLRVGIDEPDHFDDDDDDEEKEEEKRDPVVKEFKSETSLTTVTVIEDLGEDSN
ncbi:hypothetical protein BCV72DRAFT_28976 [Rhizopus microsporus var. microsporus]|uniref:Nucleolar protein 12 n=2 Tax=Rhizopus microsporus TaxID=58291 RepID=A0A2G4T2V0_RHIZD|nr:uncharacterized protein RHIMIDRAFT_248519 [Rhizopus microsporus ATCC 52813]ORE03590.1 hypothetical protein BCV72DRAFT_28976 [Rhizopus microsporus var. microsporus]PHZ15338.1 hypothetical protein RHIMIDRAFT_248519 [Rhizopus microsporus ATCC 52813]